MTHSNGPTVNSHPTLLSSFPSPAEHFDLFQLIVFHKLENIIEQLAAD